MNIQLEISFPNAVVQGQLTVTSLPAVLFNGGSQSIVEGSVIWLYCEVDSVSSSLMVTWNKDNVHWNKMYLTFL